MESIGSRIYTSTVKLISLYLCIINYNSYMFSLLLIKKQDQILNTMLKFSTVGYYMQFILSDAVI